MRMGYEKDGTYIPQCMGKDVGLWDLALAVSAPCVCPFKEEKRPLLCIFYIDQLT